MLFFLMLIPLRLSEPHTFSLRFSAAFPPRFSAICAFRLLCYITYVSFIGSIYHIIYLATIHNQHTVHLIHLELMHAHKSIKRHVPTHHRPPQLLLQAQTPPCLILPPPPLQSPPSSPSCTHLPKWRENSVSLVLLPIKACRVNAAYYYRCLYHYVLNRPFLLGPCDPRPPGVSQRAGRRRAGVGRQREEEIDSEIGN